MNRTVPTKILQCLAVVAVLVVGAVAPALASTPAIAIQIRNISSATGCLGAFDRMGLVVLIRDAMTESLKKAGEDDPHPDVRAAGCASGRETFGMWPKKVLAYGTSDTDAARNTALSAVSFLGANETFGVRITATGLDRSIREALDEKRTVNDEGEADGNGLNHLDDHSITFSPVVATAIYPYFTTKTNYVRTTIEGHRNAWPADIYFDVNLWDYLWLENGGVRCSSADPQLVVTSAWAKVLEVLSVFFNAGLLVQLDAEYTRSIGGEMSAQLGDGPACKAAQAIPAEILLPGTYCTFYFNGTCTGPYAKKMVIGYSRLAVNSAGITTAGSYTVQVRQPAAWLQIEGGNSIIRSDDSQFSALFWVTTDDLRSAVATFSASGATITPSGPNRVWITWNVPLNTSGLYTTAGLAKSVSMTVKDADGLVVSATKVVHLKFSLNPDLPPICDEQPNHYECNP